MKILLLSSALLFLVSAEHPGCKYGKGEGFEASDCDSTTGERTLILVLKKGDPSTCPPTKEIKRPCKTKNSDDSGSKCKYTLDEAASALGCDPATGTKTLRLTLAEGDPDQCQTTKSVQKKCDGKGRRGSKKNKGAKGEKRRNRGKGKQTEDENCRYTSEMSEEDDEAIPCDSTTASRSIILTLKEGSSSSCPSTKTITKSCVPDGCEYERGEWSECTDGQNEAQRTDSLKTNKDGVECAPIVTMTKSCRKVAKMEERKNRRLEERKEKQEKKEKRVQMKNDRKAERKQEKKQKKQAKKEARKEKKSKNQKRRQRQADQEAKRSRTRGQQKCKYSAGQWDECVEGLRTKISTLVEGSRKRCEPEKVRTIPCNTKSGQVRCFFGKWGEFGECNNGVRTKVRPVLSNEVDRCQRRAVKTQPC